MKSPLFYSGQDLHFFDKSLSEVCEKIEGPTYLYHLSSIRKNYESYKEELKGAGSSSQLFFAIKSNSNPEVLKCLKNAGCGVDVVSGGELGYCLKLGFKPDQILFSGVAKSHEELTEAMELGIQSVQVESVEELQRLIGIAHRRSKRVSISLRVNPDVDPKTHPYISTGMKENKFGILMAQLPKCLELIKSSPTIRFQSLSFHLGSQILELSAFQAGVKKVRKIFEDLRDEWPTLKNFDVGGGLGVNYHQDHYAPSIAEYVLTLKKELKGFSGNLFFEPGRSLVGKSGVMVSRVEYIKRTPFRNFLILNAGLSHLMRPALYGSFHEILPMQLKGASDAFRALLSKPDFATLDLGKPAMSRSLKVGKTQFYPTRSFKQKKIREIAKSLDAYDIVGPICESTDTFARQRVLPANISEGDLMVFADCGAYGAVMANNYNMHPLPQEVAF